MILKKLAVAAVVLAVGAGAAQAQLLTRQVVSLAEAQRLAAAARAMATQRRLDMAIAVVDANGDLILLERMDNVQVGSVVIAQGKALTSARLRRPTKASEDAVNQNRASLTTLFPGFTAVQGGLPITVNGQVIGAIGCSGGTSEEDEQVCTAGLAALRAQ